MVHPGATAHRVEHTVNREAAPHVHAGARVVIGVARRTERDQPGLNGGRPGVQRRRLLRHQTQVERVAGHAGPNTVDAIRTVQPPIANCHVKATIHRRQGHDSRRTGLERGAGDRGARRLGGLVQCDLDTLVIGELATRHIGDGKVGRVAGRPLPANTAEEDQLEPILGFRWAVLWVEVPGVVPPLGQRVVGRFIGRQPDWWERRRCGGGNGLDVQRRFTQQSSLTTGPSARREQPG